MRRLSNTTNEAWLHRNMNRIADMKVLLIPLAANAEEAVGSMGNDTPIAALSSRSRLLLVLQAALRAGGLLADSLDPRGGRDVGRG